MTTLKRTLALLPLAFVVALPTGCSTGAGTGSLLGAGLGTLIGEGVRKPGDKSAGDVLVGGGIGAGLGWLLGDSADKAEAQKRQRATAAEMAPLAGTTWRVVSFECGPEEPFQSMATQFGADGTVTTTTVGLDGRTQTDTERYRVVGGTLIINDRDYVINARFRLEGNNMLLDAGDCQVVLIRVNA